MPQRTDGRTHARTDERTHGRPNAGMRHRDLSVIVLLYNQDGRQSVVIVMSLAGYGGLVDSNVVPIVHRNVVAYRDSVYTT